MKYLRFIFAILCVFAVSCAGMDDIDTPASKKTGFVHTIRKDGVEFRFSLLNEQGKPSVTFREGENFSFRFEMENLRKGDKREYIAHLMGGMFARGFCDILQKNQLAYAIFQKEALCTMALETDPFDGENRLTVTLPLYDDNEEWYHGTCLYKRNPPVVLSKGNYFTGFTYTFEYRISPETWVEVGPVTMKIDFTIE